MRVNDGARRCAALEPPADVIPFEFPLRSAIAFDEVVRVESLEVEVDVEHPRISDLVIDLSKDAWPGAEMQIWTSFGWRPVAANEALPGRPGPLSYDAPQGGVGQLVFGDAPEQTLNLRLNPRYPSGARRAPSEIAADYLEVRVNYVHPELGAQP